MSYAHSIDFAHSDCFRDRKGQAITAIVIHTMEGSLKGTVSWFKTPGRTVMTSAHYCIGKDGTVIQTVPDDKAALHAGNMTWNRGSIGIEHEGFTDKGGPYTDAMLDSSAQISAALCKKYKIPVDREHIVAHHEVPNATHHDPGPAWPWDAYIAKVHHYMTV